MEVKMEFQEPDKKKKIKGMTVTNNYFTPFAIELAKSNKITLIDRDELNRLIKDFL